MQEILVFEGIVEPEKDNTHANRIRLLKRAGLLPREIDNTLYCLRKTRNSAVHAGADSVDVAKELILGREMSLCDVSAYVGFENYNYFSRIFKRYLKPIWFGIL